MILNEMGIIGIGIVWGWYIGNLKGRIHRPLTTTTAFLVSSLVVSACVFWYSDNSGLVILLISTVSALILHIIWDYELQKRYRPLRPENFEVKP